MREGWTYKKLGEVANLVADGDWIESKDQSDCGIRLIQTGNVGNGFFKSKEDRPHYISEETMSRLGCTEIFEGDCLVSRLPDPVGRACLIPHLDCRMITAVDCSIIRFSDNYLPQFFVDYSQSSNYRISINNNTTGTTRKRISRKNLENILIPVPPIEEQERIVSELDLLSSIIEKKKEQLKEYDKLAQSIFYDMFGDPVINEKGWEVKTFGDVCVSMTKGPFGSDIKKSLFVPKSNDTYKVYIQANAIEKDISLGDYYISKDYFESKMFRFEVKPNDYIITCDGTLGKYLRLPHNIERGVISASLLRLTLNDIINHRYFEYLWDYYILQQQTKDIRNTALKHLPSATNMGKTPIPLPPLSLQQSFAEMVEAIGKQKALVQQSISETQTLFESTMDKYFG